MKNLFLISIGLCTLLVEPALAGCTQEACLPSHFGCDKAFPSYPIPVTSPNKPACTVQGMSATLVKCCSSEIDANELREKYARINNQQMNKALAKAIMAAEENEYPHQVQLKTRGNCGGAVYNKNWIITAAHCVRLGDPQTFTTENGLSQQNPGDPYKQVYVIAGTSHVAEANVQEANKYNVDKVIWHDDWNPNKIDEGNDIALLHLAKPLALEKGKIQPLRLAPAGYIPNYGGNGVIIGFGNVDERLDGTDDLMETVAPIHHKATGNEMSFEPINASPHGKPLKSTHLAIGGGDSGVVVGQGDSGGPLICGDGNNKPILCGIVSFKECPLYKVCRKPSYYQNVEPMLSWIKKNVGGEAQEETLIFDEPLFPEKVPDKKVHPSLVRISHSTISCVGVLVTRKLILTTAGCAKHGGLATAHPLILGTNINVKI